MRCFRTELTIQGFSVRYFENIVEFEFTKICSVIFYHFFLYLYQFYLHGDLHGKHILRTNLWVSFALDRDSVSVIYQGCVFLKTKSDVYLDIIKFCELFQMHV